MPGLDRVLSPLTGDYVSAPGGEFAETLTISTALFHQMKTERNRWSLDPAAGSDLHLAKHYGAGVGGKVFTENAIREAAKPLVDEGLAADVEVEIAADARGRIVAVASITDVQHGPLEVAAPIGDV